MRVIQEGDKVGFRGWVYAVTCNNHRGHLQVRNESAPEHGYWIFENEVELLEPSTLLGRLTDDDVRESTPAIGESVPMEKKRVFELRDEENLKVAIVVAENMREALNIYYTNRGYEPTYLYEITDNDTCVWIQGIDS